MGTIKTLKASLLIISWLMGGAQLFAKEDVNSFMRDQSSHFNRSTFQIPQHLDRVGSFYIVDPMHDVFFAYNVMQSERMGMITLALGDQFFGGDNALRTTIDDRCPQQWCFITALRQINLGNLIELYALHQARMDIFVREAASYLAETFKSAVCKWGHNMVPCLTEAGKVAAIFHMSLETHLISPGLQESPQNLPGRFNKLQEAYGQIFVGFYKLMEPQFITSCEEKGFFQELVVNLKVATEGFWVNHIPHHGLFNFIMKTNDELLGASKEVISIYLNTLNYGQGHYFFFRADKFHFVSEEKWFVDPLPEELSTEWATSLNIMLIENGTCPLVSPQKECAFDFPLVKKTFQKP